MYQAEEFDSAEAIATALAYRHGSTEAAPSELATRCRWSRSDSHTGWLRASKSPQIDAVNCGEFARAER
ncbi:MAG: hypothetical protein ACJAV2_003565, partial [Myxococcota bacterium]